MKLLPTAIPTSYENFWRRTFTKLRGVNIRGYVNLMMLDTRYMKLLNFYWKMPMMLLGSILNLPSTST